MHHLPGNESVVVTEGAMRAIAQRADRMMLGVITFGALGALGIGLVYGRLGTAAAWAAALLVLAVVAYAQGRGTQIARAMMVLCSVAMVVLHIQLSMGSIEYHFGVFVLLAFLLVYRDWRPVVGAAALFAVHHIAFDRLQLAGMPLYCLSEPDFGRILLHASYVVVQTAVEVGIAMRMRTDAFASAELEALCRPQADGQLSLDVRGLVVTTPTALALHAALQRLNDAVADVHSTAVRMSSASTQIAQGNHELSERTERTAAHLQEAAASVEQLDSVVRRSVQDAASARGLTAQAEQMAEQCGSVVGDVVSTMQDIQTGSRRISDILGLIDGIAFQTNLLALNAAVEAARAGEQGRGFAVVASEVRGLAGRSANAAHEVRALIATSLQQADRGTTLVAEAGRRMTTVVESARRASEVVSTISSAVQGQSSELSSVNASVTELDQMTQQNATLVEQAAASSASLTEQAMRLLRIVEGFTFRAQSTPLRLS
jgi:methyl-accepting chemotaxis protein